VVDGDRDVSVVVIHQTRITFLGQKSSRKDNLIRDGQRNVKLSNSLNCVILKQSKFRVDLNMLLVIALKA